MYNRTDITETKNKRNKQKKDKRNKPQGRDILGGISFERASSRHSKRAVPNRNAGGQKSLIQKTTQWKRPSRKRDLKSDLVGFVPSDSLALNHFRVFRLFIFIKSAPRSRICIFSVDIGEWDVWQKCEKVLNVSLKNARFFATSRVSGNKCPFRVFRYLNPKSSPPWYYTFDLFFVFFYSDVSEEGP